MVVQVEPNDLEREEFLSAPLLFRIGPNVLMAVGLLLALGMYVAAQWRVVEGRRGEYAKALKFSEATALASAEHADQVLKRLRQAARRIESQASDAEVSRRIEEGLDLYDIAAGIYGLNVHSTILASSTNIDSLEGLARAASEGAPEAVGSWLRPALTLRDGTAIVPVVVRLDSTAAMATRTLVFLLPSEVFINPAQAAFGRAGGWFDLSRGTQAPVLTVHSPRDDLPVLRSIDAAMADPLDFEAQRIIAGPTAGKGDVTVRVGLHEADALREFRTRVEATWVIVWSGVGLILAMVCLTSYAIHAFGRKEAYLRRLATVDVLTGLPNRRSFQGLLSKAVLDAQRRNTDLALLFVDIDDFKQVNDSAGHALGDTLLIHVARVLTAVAASNPVCRLAGDEFTVLVPDAANPDAVLRLGNRIVERLQQLAVIDGVEFRTRASIGIARYPRDAASGAELMQFADTALYQAKGQGKARCIAFDASMAARALQHAQSVRELEQAIAHDQLFLEYQPKFDLGTGAPAGHEALVRWQHPVRGRVPPGEFIHLAESSGLINQLGMWVLRQAVSQVRQWHADGFGWQRVAVNVSPLQFRSHDFAALVASVLREFEVAGEMLQLEITEGSLAADMAQAQSTVRALRRLDVLVSVDDFGTGYSSLGALQQFELDMLKLDRSFVLALGTHEGEQICRAIATLGQALGLCVVAEGIETREQAETLYRLGCDQGQGFFLARPGSADAACRIGSVEGFGAPAGWHPLRGSRPVRLVG